MSSMSTVLNDSSYDSGQGKAFGDDSLKVQRTLRNYPSTILPVWQTAYRRSTRYRPTSSRPTCRQHPQAVYRPDGRADGRAGG